MKRRVIAMMLALVMLCALVACGEEEYGEFYTEDDLLQNTQIKCVVTQAGAREIAYEIRNATPYSIWIKAVALHVYQDGAWEKAPFQQDGHLWVDRDHLGGWRGTCKEVYEEKVDFAYYKTVYPGEYRIVVEMEAKKNGYKAETEVFYATACFTVTNEVYGVFEEKGGILQNSLVTLQVTNYDFDAPFLDPWYHLENKSAFDVEQQKYADDGYGYLLEKQVDGAWVPCPTYGEIVRENVEEKDFYLPEQTESGAADLMEKRYIALEAGEYRMRVKYTATCGVDDVEIPEGQLEAVAYFTVTAPVQ